MSLINDALKKAQSLQAAAAQQPPAAPPPAPVAAPAPAATTPPLKLSLATPAPAPAAPAAAAAPRLTLAPTAPAAPAAPIKLSLAAPATPAVSTDAAPAPAPAAPTPPAGSPASAPAAAPAPTEDDSLESLRQLYKQAGHDDATANEKAIAARALDPTGLKLALPPVVAPAAPAAAVSTTPLQPAGPAPAPAVNPLTGLRAPTPEAAAAFLASHPISHPTTPAPGASILDLPPTTDDGTPPPVPARSAPPPARRKKTANPETVLLWVGSVLAIVLGGGLTAAYLLLRDPAKPATDVTAEAAETSDADAPPPPDTAAPAPVAATPEPAPAPTPETPSTGTAPADPAPEVAAEPPPPPPPPPRINRPDPTILAWVQKIELTGIRGGASPKVFMNGKLYDVGETVNYDFSLKLTVVQGKLLIFEDAEGNTYEYRF